MTAVNLFKAYETDNNMEKNGVDINVDGAIFKCRRAGGANRRYRVVLSEEMEKYKETFLKHKPDSEKALEDYETVKIQAFAKCVVIDWKNVSDREGNDWPFTPENFIELMSSCPDLWTFLSNQVNDYDNFRIRNIVETAETLGNGSKRAKSGKA